jgi:hypothetical protein
VARNDHREKAQQNPWAVRQAAIDQQDGCRRYQTQDTAHDSESDDAETWQILITSNGQVRGKHRREGTEHDAKSAETIARWV